jgi:hypothetical protein
VVGLQRVKEEVRGHGFVVDDRDYATNFRVDVARSTNTGDAAADARMQGLWAKVLGEMEGRGLACSFNLGKADVYPLASGKAPSVQRLMTRLFLDRAECAALFDDDNDVAMAELCANRRFAVSVTHPNVQKVGHHARLRRLRAHTGKHRLIVGHGSHLLRSLVCSDSERVYRCILCCSCWSVIQAWDGCPYPGSSGLKLL